MENYQEKLTLWQNELKDIDNKILDIHENYQVLNAELDKINAILELANNPFDKEETRIDILKRAISEGFFASLFSGFLLNNLLDKVNNNIENLVYIIIGLGNFLILSKLKFLKYYNLNQKSLLQAKRKILVKMNTEDIKNSEVIDLIIKREELKIKINNLVSYLYQQTCPNVLLLEDKKLERIKYQC